MGDISPDKRTSLLTKSFITWRDKPRIWLLLSLASLPLYFLRMGLLKSTGSSEYVLLGLLGDIIIFCIVFLLWCRAALFYYYLNGNTQRQEIDRLWRNKVANEKKYILRLSLSFWLFQMIYLLIVIIPIFIVLLILAWVRGSEAINTIVNESWFFLTMIVSYILSSLLVVRICMTPQIAMLTDQTDRVKVMATMRVSIKLVQEDYRRILFMFLPPWILGYILYYFLGQLARDNINSAYLFFLILLAMAFVEGGRVSFIAAGFSEYYREVYG